MPHREDWVWGAADGCWICCLPLTPEDSNLPERPIEIRVWYLRGALDDDIGMIRALKAKGGTDDCGRIEGDKPSKLVGLHRLFRETRETGPVLFAKP